MALIQIIYTGTFGDEISGVQETFTKVIYQLAQLKKIRGMLLHSRGTVLQALEGDEVDVERTYVCLQSVVHHETIYPLCKRNMPEPEFKSWSLGSHAAALKALIKHVDGPHLFKANRREIESRVVPGAASALLVFFAEEFSAME